MLFLTSSSQVTPELNCTQWAWLAREDQTFKDTVSDYILFLIGLAKDLALSC